MVRSWVVLASVAVGVLTTWGSAARADEEGDLRAGCAWLEQAVQRTPDRDDSFGMFMRGMKPKCKALLEGLERKDGSVTQTTLHEIAKELTQLRAVIDGDFGEDSGAAKGGDKAATDKAAADKAAADKAAADKAAADNAVADKAAADKAAADKAAADRMTAAERAAADKAAAAAERAAADKAAADKKAAERQARLDAQRSAADKAAADKAAAQQAAAEKAAGDKAAAARAAEQKALADKAEADREQAEKDQKALQDRLAAELAAAGKASKSQPKALGGRLDGTWEQPAAKVLDRNLKRTLNIITHGKAIEGEVYEEVWYDAPSSWVDKSCNGNKIFRMVTTGRITGEVDGGPKLTFWREPPHILACTCASRCTVETRRRGFGLDLSSSGEQLSDSTGVFWRAGGSAKTQVDANGLPVIAKRGPIAVGGVWATPSFGEADRKVVLRLELAQADKNVTGTLIEKSSAPFPLKSWGDRYCGGASRFEWVTEWSISGKLEGDRTVLKGASGKQLMCNCPSKCKPPEAKRTLTLEVGPDGRSLVDGDARFERQ